MRVQHWICSQATQKILSHLFKANHGRRETPKLQTTGKENIVWLYCTHGFPQASKTLNMQLYFACSSVGLWLILHQIFVMLIMAKHTFNINDGILTLLQCWIHQSGCSPLHQFHNPPTNVTSLMMYIHFNKLLHKLNIFRHHNHNISKNRHHKLLCKNLILHAEKENCGLGYRGSLMSIKKLLQ